MTTHAPQGYVPQTAADKSGQPAYVQYPNAEGKLVTYAVYQTASGPVGYEVSSSLPTQPPSTDPSSILPVPPEPAEKNSKGGGKRMIVVAAVAAAIAIAGGAVYGVPKYLDSRSATADKASSSIFDNLDENAPAPGNDHRPSQPTVPQPSLAPRGSINITGTDAPVNSEISRAAGALNAFWKENTDPETWHPPTMYVSLNNGNVDDPATNGQCGGHPPAKLASACDVDVIVWNSQAMTALQQSGGSGALLFALGVGYGQNMQGTAATNVPSMTVGQLQTATCYGGISTARSGWVEPEEAEGVINAWLDAEGFDANLESQVLDAVGAGLKASQNGDVAAGMRACAEFASS